VRSIEKVYLEEMKRNGDENSKMDLREMDCDSRNCIEAQEPLKKQWSKLSFRKIR
jgi:hypothetical protein